MTELVVKSTDWKQVPIVRTKKEFENGASEFVLTLKIECEIPKGYEPLRNSNPDIFIVSNGKTTPMMMVGYHVVNNVVYFSCFNKYEKSFEFKVYMA